MDGFREEKKLVLIYTTVQTGEENGTGSLKELRKLVFLMEVGEEEYFEENRDRVYSDVEDHGYMKLRMRIKEQRSINNVFQTD